MTDLAMRTKPSPRFEKDALCIYEGDTFDMELTLEITRDDQIIDIQPEDVVTFEFRNCHGYVVASKEFTNIENRIIIFDWNKEFTDNFHRGKYSYRMKYNGDYISTMVADNIVVVS